MNIEIVKAKDKDLPHAFVVEVDGVPWATIHREYRSRYGTRYWFQHASGSGGIKREKGGCVYVWSSSSRLSSLGDTSPKTLVPRLKLTAEQLISKGLLISPAAETARREAIAHRYRRVAEWAETKRMKKLLERAEAFILRQGLPSVLELKEALAKEFAAVIELGL